eukprot:snap_masked-scaffold_39-processed-gene-0.16-mRNA-1 protein AED:0.30 eAED:1.00 QI:0/-1/0/1/-1/1/1/0/195
MIVRRHDSEEVLYENLNSNFCPYPKFDKNDMDQVEKLKKQKENKEAASARIRFLRGFGQKINTSKGTSIRRPKRIPPCVGPIVQAGQLKGQVRARGKFRHRLFRSSKFKGVFWGEKCNKYIAKIRCEHVKMEIGEYDNAVQAAVAVDEKILSLGISLTPTIRKKLLNYPNDLDRLIAKKGREQRWKIAIAKSKRR